MNNRFKVCLLVFSLALVACLDKSDEADLADNDPPVAIDTTPPALSSGAPSGSLSASTSETAMSLISDELADCRYGTQAGTSYANLANTFSTTGGNSHSTTVRGLTEGQQYNFYVRCEDMSGNSNLTDFPIQFEVTSSPADSTAPVRSNGAPIGTLSVGTRSTDLSLSTNEGANCRFGSQAGITYGNLSDTFSTTGGTNHSTNVSGLTDGMQYIFYVRCEDASGNANADDFTIQFNIASSPTDSAAPVRSNGAPNGTLNVGTRSTDISLSTDEIATCKYGSQAGTSYAGLTDTFSDTGGTSHSTNVSGLSDGVQYIFYVRCQDAAGNANPNDFSIQFDVASPPIDSVAPIRSNGAPSGVLAAGTRSIELSLTTNENAICRYGTTSGEQYTAMPDQFNGTGGTSHASTIDGLADGQQYVYYIRCADFAANANNDDFEIRFSISQPSSGVTVSDSFDGNGPLLNYTTNNESSLPDVARVNGRYRAELVDNTNEITLHFNNSQGRLDAKTVDFPFEYIARNIGIGTIADSQSAPSSSGSPFIFSGIQIHVLDLNSRNSAHFVVGHRGSTAFTVEGKNTVNGSSSVNDDGANILPDGRADLRVVGQADKSLRWYWQRPNLNPGVQNDNWNLYRGTGVFPGNQASFGDQVYIGLITYAFRQGGVPFVGTADSVELVGE